MNPISKIPALKWSPIAAEEIALTGQQLLDQSDFTWQVGQVAICGLIYSNYLRPPWFWFALAEGATMRDLIDFRRLAQLIPEGAMTAVRSDRPTAIRFAEFYGFSDTGTWRGHGGFDYKIFRRD